MKLVYLLGLSTTILLSSFVANTTAEYQLLNSTKIKFTSKIHPSTAKPGTYLLTEPKQLKTSFPELTVNDMASFDFENNRIVYIQFPEKQGCSEEVEVITEVRKYKHYYEIILTQIPPSTCTTRVKPYQLTSIPNDGLPLLMTGNLPE